MKPKLILNRRIGTKAETFKFNVGDRVQAAGLSGRLTIAARFKADNGLAVFYHVKDSNGQIWHRENSELRLA